MTPNEIKKLLGVKMDRPADVIMITPIIAKKILKECNTKNRKLCKSNVEKYKRIIESGTWHLVTDCIGFDKDGVLTNGQHRLTAISECGKSVMAGVMFNVEASTAIDNQKTRSFSDNIAICDIAEVELRDEQILHKVFKKAYEFRNGSSQKIDISDDVLAKLMNVYSKELIACYNAKLFKKMASAGCNALAVKTAFFLAYLNGVKLDTLVHISNILETGSTESEDLPIVELKNKLYKITGGGAGKDKERMALTQAAIYKVTRHQKTRTLRPSSTIYTYKKFETDTAELKKVV